VGTWRAHCESFQSSTRRTFQLPRSLWPLAYTRHPGPQGSRRCRRACVAAHDQAPSYQTLIRAPPHLRFAQVRPHERQQQRRIAQRNSLPARWGDVFCGEQRHRQGAPYAQYVRGAHAPWDRQPASHLWSRATMLFVSAHTSSTNISRSGGVLESWLFGRKATGDT
jgi:hypothetical protein